MKPTEFALSMLGAPCVKIELNETQLAVIEAYVKNAVANSSMPDKLKEQAILDGVLAYAKYVLGRIRSKFHKLNGDCIPYDGPELLKEANLDIRIWRKTLGLDV